MSETTKKEYKEFRAMLTKWMEGYSQREYALKVGMTPAHLNRMLNNQEIVRPSLQTLEKLLLCRNPECNPYELFESLGYSRIDCKFALRKYRHQFTLPQQMKMMSDEVLIAWNAMIRKLNVYQTLQQAMGEFRLHYGVELNGGEWATEVLPNHNASHKGDHFIGGRVYWNVDKDGRQYHEVCTYFVVYCVALQSGGYLITDVAVDGEALADAGVVEQCILDDLYEDGESLQNLKFFSVATLKTRKSKYATRLMQAVFGVDENGNPVDTQFYHMDWGRGSVWAATPSHFCEYVRKNKQYFSKTEQELEILDMIEDMRAPRNCFEAEKFFEEYRYSNATGTVACVLAIVNRKIEEMGKDWELEYDESEQYQDSLKPCIYIAEDTYCFAGKTDKKVLEEIDTFLKQEFLDLFLPTYGTTLVYHSVGINLNEARSWQEPLSFQYGNPEISQKKNSETISEDVEDGGETLDENEDFLS